MKEGWKIKRLVDACDVYQPKTISAKDLIPDGEYTVYGANGEIGRYNQYNHKDSEVLLTCRGATCGNINVSKPYSWINGNAMVIHPKEESLQKQYLCYFLKTLDYSKVITGAAQPQITRTSLSDLTIVIPDFSEQQRIVEYLDSAFAKIDALKAKSKENLDNAQALFQAALTDMMTPKEGWEEKKVGEIADIKGGKRIPKGYSLQSEPTKHKYIRVSDFNDFGTVDLCDIKYISDSIYEQIKRYIIKKEDIYISIAGTIGKSGIIPDELDGANLTENACRLILSKEIEQRFMYYVTISPEFISKIKKSTKIAAQPKLALTRLAEIDIAYPSLADQQRIVSTLDSIKTKVDSLQATFSAISSECDALKQSLLRQVFE